MATDMDRNLGNESLNKPKVYGVLFDFGGTLARYNGSSREEILRDILKDQGIIANKEELKRGTVKAIIIFDSIARKRILGRTAGREIEIIRRCLSETAPTIGFYSYGQQAPLGAMRYIGKSYFHNEAVVVLCIAEEK